MMELAAKQLPQLVLPSPAGIAGTGSARTVAARAAAMELLRRFVGEAGQAGIVSPMQVQPLMDLGTRMLSSGGAMAASASEEGVLMAAALSGPPRSPMQSEPGNLLCGAAPSMPLCSPGAPQLASLPRSAGGRKSRCVP
jgi:hypothetical protein